MASGCQYDRWAVWLAREETELPWEREWNIGRARLDEGIRRMRFEDLLWCHERGAVGQEAAAEMLGFSDRTFRRRRDRLPDEGPGGLSDRRLHPSKRRADTTEIDGMLELYRTRCVASR